MGYWGYVAKVESYDGSDDSAAEASIRSVPRSREEAMSLATNLMLSQATNYAEYKQMRENLDGFDDFIDMLRTIEVETPGDRRPMAPLQQSRRETGMLYDQAQRPEMPSLQPEEQEKLKLEEQLARLRARRQRPTPEV